jgi:hypothetical protein
VANAQLSNVEKNNQPNPFSYVFSTSLYLKTRWFVFEDAKSAMVVLAVIFE